MKEVIVSAQLPVGEALEIRKNHILPQGVNAERVSGLKRICIVTGIHGDELEGQYVCWKLNQCIAAEMEHLKGIVDIYPALNPLGINSITRGIPMFDLDMNRIFPGNGKGAMAEYIASEIIEDIKGADACIDIHASNIFLREIPQVRINENMAERLVPMAKLLNTDFIWIHGAATVLQSTLAHSLNSLHTPTLVVEMGVGMRITKAYGDQLVQGIFALMRHLGIWDGEAEPVKTPIVSSDGEVGFVNANACGIFLPSVEHDAAIAKGQELGVIVDPLSGNIRERLLSPCDGLLFTLREYPIVYSGSLIARVLGGLS